MPRGRPAAPEGRREGPGRRVPRRHRAALLLRPRPPADARALRVGRPSARDLGRPGGGDPPLRDVGRHGVVRRDRGEPVLHRVGPGAVRPPLPRGAAARPAAGAPDLPHGRRRGEGDAASGRGHRPPRARGRLRRLSRRGGAVEVRHGRRLGQRRAGAHPRRAVLRPPLRQGAGPQPRLVLARVRGARAQPRPPGTSTARTTASPPPTSSSSPRCATEASGTPIRGGPATC